MSKHIQYDSQGNGYELTEELIRERIRIYLKLTLAF